MWPNVRLLHQVKDAYNRESVDSDLHSQSLLMCGMAYWRVMQLIW